MEKPSRGFVSKTAVAMLVGSAQAPKRERCSAEFIGSAFVSWRIGEESVISMFYLNESVGLWRLLQPTSAWLTAAASHEKEVVFRAVHKLWESHATAQAQLALSWLGLSSLPSNICLTKLCCISKFFSAKCFWAFPLHEVSSCWGREQTSRLSCLRRTIMPWRQMPNVGVISRTGESNSWHCSRHFFF